MPKSLTLNETFRNRACCHLQSLNVTCFSCSTAVLRNPSFSIRTDLDRSIRAGHCCATLRCHPTSPLVPLGVAHSDSEVHTGCTIACHDATTRTFCKKPIKRNFNNFTKKLRHLHHFRDSSSLRTFAPSAPAAALQHPILNRRWKAAQSYFSSVTLVFAHTESLVLLPGSSVLRSTHSTPLSCQLRVELVRPHSVARSPHVIVHESLHAVRSSLLACRHLLKIPQLRCFATSQRSSCFATAPLFQHFVRTTAPSYGLSLRNQSS